MGRKIGNMIMDNLSLVVWLIENQLQKPMRYIGLSEGNSLKFCMEDGPELSVDQGIFARQIKPVINIASEVYGCDTKYPKFEGDKVILQSYPEKTVSKKDFEREMRNALITKIELDCIVNNIPHEYSDLEKLYSSPIVNVLTVYGDIKKTIRDHGYDSTPLMPLKLSTILERHTPKLTQMF